MTMILAKNTITTGAKWYHYERRRKVKDGDKDKRIKGGKWKEEEKGYWSRNYNLFYWNCRIGWASKAIAEEIVACLVPILSFPHFFVLILLFHSFFLIFILLPFPFFHSYYFFLSFPFLFLSSILILLLPLLSFSYSPFFFFFSSSTHILSSSSFFSILIPLPLYYLLLSSLYFLLFSVSLFTYPHFPISHFHSFIAVLFIFSIYFF